MTGTRITAHTGAVVPPLPNPDFEASQDTEDLGDTPRNSQTPICWVFGSFIRLC
jgi:hypothetical protein